MVAILYWFIDITAGPLPQDSYPQVVGANWLLTDVTQSHSTMRLFSVLHLARWIFLFTPNRMSIVFKEIAVGLSLSHLVGSITRLFHWIVAGR